MDGNRSTDLDLDHINGSDIEPDGSPSTTNTEQPYYVESSSDLETATHPYDWSATTDQENTQQYAGNRAVVQPAEHSSSHVNTYQNQQVQGRGSTTQQHPESQSSDENALTGEGVNPNDWSSDDVDSDRRRVRTHPSTQSTQAADDFTTTTTDEDEAENRSRLTSHQHTTREADRGDDTPSGSVIYGSQTNPNSERNSNYSRSHDNTTHPLEVRPHPYTSSDSELDTQPNQHNGGAVTRKGSQRQRPWVASHNSAAADLAKYSHSNRARENKSQSRKGDKRKSKHLNLGNVGLASVPEKKGSDSEHCYADGSGNFTDVGSVHSKDSWKILNKNKNMSYPATEIDFGENPKPLVEDKTNSQEPNNRKPLPNNEPTFDSELPAEHFMDIIIPHIHVSKESDAPSHGTRPKTTDGGPSRLTIFSQETPPKIRAAACDRLPKEGHTVLEPQTTNTNRLTDSDEVNAEEHGKTTTEHVERTGIQNGTENSQLLNASLKSSPTIQMGSNNLTRNAENIGLGANNGNRGVDVGSAGCERDSRSEQVNRQDNEVTKPERNCLSTCQAGCVTFCVVLFVVMIVVVWLVSHYTKYLHVSTS